MWTITTPKIKRIPIQHRPHHQNGWTTYFFVLYIFNKHRARVQISWIIDLKSFLPFAFRPSSSLQQMNRCNPADDVCLMVVATNSPTTWRYAGDCYYHHLPVQVDRKGGNADRTTLLHRPSRTGSRIGTSCVCNPHSFRSCCGSVDRPGRGLVTSTLPVLERHLSTAVLCTFRR